MQSQRFASPQEDSSTDLSRACPRPDVERIGSQITFQSISGTHAGL